MSQAQYTTVKAHIVMDIEKAQAVLEGLQKVIDDQQTVLGQDRDCEVKYGEGFEELLARITAAPNDSLLGAMKAVGELENESYGAMIVESDYGVDGYECFGDAEFAKVDEPDVNYAWVSEDFLELRVSMKAGEWLGFLGCGGGSLAGEIESRGTNLLAELLPEGLSQSLEEAGLTFEYHDVEPYRGEGEQYDADEEVEAVFELEGHELEHSAFKALKEAVNDAVANPVRPGVGIHLCFTYAGECEGSFVNTMVDIEAFAILTFSSSRDGVVEDTVRVLKATER